MEERIPYGVVHGGAAGNTGKKEREKGKARWERKKNKVQKIFFLSVLLNVAIR